MRMRGNTHLIRMRMRVSYMFDQNEKENENEERYIRQNDPRIFSHPFSFSLWFLTLKLFLKEFLPVA